MSKGKIILIILALIVFIVGLAVALILVKQRQDIRKQAAPATSLALSPSTQTKAVGADVNFTVKMTTGANNVTGVQLEIIYNPAVLDITAPLTRGTGLPADFQILNDDDQVDSVTGKIVFIAFTTNKTKAITGSDIEVVKIVGRVKASAPSGASNLTWGSSTAVSGVGEGTNVLSGKTDAVINVTGGSGGNPTATPTLTPTPTAPGGATDTPEPTATDEGTGGEDGETTEPTQAPTELIDAGVSLPTAIGIGAGIILLVASALLAL